MQFVNLFEILQPPVQCLEHRPAILGGNRHVRDQGGLFDHGFADFGFSVRQSPQHAGQ